MEKSGLLQHASLRMTVLLAESEGDLQRVVNEFYSVCKRRKLKVNAGKSKVMVFGGGTLYGGRRESGNSLFERRR